MSDDFNNINLEDVNLEEYDSIDVRFSEEEKERLKKNLRKKIIKDNSKFKKRGLVAAVAVILISVLVITNGNNVFANMLPVFNKLYEGFGFKSEYLPQSVYVGKTYEENGVKITLENLIGTKHVIKVAVKIQYDSKWPKSKRPLVHLGYDFQGQFTGSSGGLGDINDNTELRVIDFTSEKEFLSKGNFKIQAISDAFKQPLVWNMKVDFSKIFNETIEKQATMVKDIGVNVSHIEANRLGVVVTSNKSLGFTEYFFKINNKIYPFSGECFGVGNGKFYNISADIGYNLIKNNKTVQLIKHTNEGYENTNRKEETKEEGLKDDEIEAKQLEAFPKGEINGVSFTKSITFKDGNKAEIYKIDRSNGKIHAYVRGNDKKQVFNMILSLYLNNGSFAENIEDIGDGYIVEFNDPSKSDKVSIKMSGGVLDCKGDYKEEQSEITLK